MNAVLTRMTARLDAMEVKERLLVALAAVLVLIMLWFKLWFEPLQQQQRQLTARASAAQLRIDEAESIITQIKQAAAADLNAPVCAQTAESAGAILSAKAAIRGAAVA